MMPKAIHTEIAYRRGFVHGMNDALVRIRRGDTHEEIETWAESVEQWRDQPVGAISPQRVVKTLEENHQ